MLIQCVRNAESAPAVEDHEYKGHKNPLAKRIGFDLAVRLVVSNSDSVYESYVFDNLCLSWTIVLDV